jgi:16S rRNA (guanine527-N7)-methyltransferase
MLYDILSDGLKAWNIDITVSQIEKFKTLTQLMLEYNKKVNLTRITDIDDVIKLHYLDSLSILSVLDIPKKSKIIDIGTGAGVPGLPLKILREDLDIVLLDSLNKRIDYLKMAANRLELNKITFLHQRSEELAHDALHREAYDFVVSRAVALLPKLCELCLAYVKIGGYFIAYKGKDAEKEVDLAKNAVKSLGGRLIEVKPVQIYQSGTEHSLVIIKKTNETPKQYPRTNSVILKKPL